MNAETRNRFVPSAFASAWDRASSRERRLAIAGVALVVIALGWGFLWQPLKADIERTREDRVRVGTLLALARSSFDEGTGLARASPKPAVVDPRGAVTRAFADRGVRVPAGGIDVRDNRVHVVLPDVQFDALVGALDALARDDGLRPVEATLTARVAPGTLRAELTFGR
ncbi:MAG TPA: type II secretion system protein GspM [Casimicrobiaceae bacterium]|jgi:type II secretory pathway component PulM